MNDNTTATKYILSMPFDAKFVPIIPELAMQIGFYESILLQQISIWIKNSTNIHEGKYWAYKSLRDIHDEDIPYLSIEKIRRVIQNLKDQGYILIGDFNEKGYDRTQWFALEPDKCSSLLGVFVNVLSEKKDLSTAETPLIPLSEAGGVSTAETTIPESLIPNTTDKSTYLSTASQVERVSDPDPEPDASDDEQVDLFGTIPKTEPMRNVHKAAKTIATASEPTTPYKAIVSPVVEEDVVVVEPAGKPKTKRPRKEGVTPAECINPMKAAIMKSFGWSWKTISNSEKGQVYNAAKQLCDCNFPVGEIQDLYDFCAGMFDKFGPVALTGHQSDYRKEHRPQNIAPELLGPQKKVVPVGVWSIVRQGWDKVREYNIDLAYWEIDPSRVGVG